MACKSQYVDKCYEELKQFINELPTKKGSLIAVLRKAQAIFGDLSDDIIDFIALSLGVHSSEVYGVVSFYSFLNTKKQGDFVV